MVKNGFMIKELGVENVVKVETENITQGLIGNVSNINSQSEKVADENMNVLVSKRPIN